MTLHPLRTSQHLRQILQRYRSPRARRYTASIDLFIGMLLCITIVGIPFGQQCFRLIEIQLTPFGMRIV